MTAPTLSAICESIIGAGRIHVADVLALRHAVLTQGGLTPGDAERLFELARADGPACAQWSEFFADVVSAHLVEEVAPRGALSEENANWLVAMIEAAPLSERLAFEVASAVMRKAALCPSGLMRFVLTRLNNLSALATQDSAEPLAQDLEVARHALQAAGLAGRLYTPRPRPPEALAA